jgi:hypothetical protein
MSTFSVKGNNIDGESIISTIKEKIDEKRGELYTEEEVREIAEMKLEPILDASEFSSDFIDVFRARESQWNYTFDPDTIYVSQRGGAGRLVTFARKLLNPVLKLLFNPGPIIGALSRQSDLNLYYVQLLHNMMVEMTKMNLEMTNMKARQRALGIQVDFLGRREKMLEKMMTNQSEARGSDTRRGSRSRRRDGSRRRGGRSNGGGDRAQNSGASAIGGSDDTLKKG